jgi:hypothetical protein
VQQLKYNLTEPEYDVSVRNMYWRRRKNSLNVSRKVKENIKKYINNIQGCFSTKLILYYPILLLTEKAE